MHLLALIRKDAPAELRHPEIGRVLWHDDASGVGWRLVFAGGPEAGMPLEADESVLFDDRWELVEGLPPSFPGPEPSGRQKTLEDALRRAASPRGPLGLLEPRAAPGQVERGRPR